MLTSGAGWVQVGSLYYHFPLQSHWVVSTCCSLSLFAFLSLIWIAGAVLDFLQLTNLGAWQASFVRGKLSWVNFAVNTKQIERKNWWAGSRGGILDSVRENPTHASLWGRVVEENISEIPDNKYLRAANGQRELCHQLLTELLLPLLSKWPRDYLNRSVSGNSSQSKIF